MFWGALEDVLLSGKLSPMFVSLSHNRFLTSLLRDCLLYRFCLGVGLETHYLIEITDAQTRVKLLVSFLPS